jgi:hypothetical protein
LYTIFPHLQVKSSNILIAKEKDKENKKRKQDTRKTGMAHHRKTLKFAMLVKEKMREKVPKDQATDDKRHRKKGIWRNMDWRPPRRKLPNPRRKQQKEEGKK